MLVVGPDGSGETQAAFVEAGREAGLAVSAFNMAELPGQRHFGWQLLDALRRFDVRFGEHILLDDPGVSELDALLEGLLTTDIDESPLLHVLLRRQPDEPAMLAGGAATIKTVLQRFFRAGLWPAHVLFYAQSVSLASAYEQLSPVQVLALASGSPTESAKQLLTAVRQGANALAPSANAQMGTLFDQSPEMLLIASLESIFADQETLRDVSMLAGHLRRAGYRVLCAFHSAFQAPDEQQLADYTASRQAILRDSEITYAWICRCDDGCLRTPEGLRRFIASRRLDAAVAYSADSADICRELDIPSDQTLCYIREASPEKAVELAGAGYQVVTTTGNLAAALHSALPDAPFEWLPTALDYTPVGSSELAGCTTLADVFRAAGISSGGMARGRDFDWLLQRALVAERLDLICFASREPASVRSFHWFYTSVFLPFLAPRGITAAVVGDVDTALPDTCHQHSQLFLTGRVANERPLLAAACLVIAPIVERSGVSLRTVEALLAGKPLVATSLAVSGLQFQGLTTFDESVAFGKRILALLGDGAARNQAREDAFTAGTCANDVGRFDRGLAAAMSRVLPVGARVPQPALTPRILPPPIEWSSPLASANGRLARTATV
ncbi:MAG: glycosyltransferase [Chloroflexota bacterium]|nr:glycosyltransferase [Chloroflexota bacterium]